MSHFPLVHPSIRKNKRKNNNNNNNQKLKEKKKKRNINIDLAVLPSYDSTKQPTGKLMSNSIPKKPWMHILADFITKLPLAQV